MENRFTREEMLSMLQMIAEGKATRAHLAEVINQPEGYVIQLNLGCGSTEKMDEKKKNPLIAYYDITLDLLK